MTNVKRFLIWFSNRLYGHAPNLFRSILLPLNYTLFTSQPENPLD